MNELFERIWCWAIRDENGRLIILFKSSRLPAGAMQKGWTAECTTVARVFEDMGVCVFTEGDPKKKQRLLPASSKLD